MLHRKINANIMATNTLANMRRSMILKLAILIPRRFHAPRNKNALMKKYGVESVNRYDGQVCETEVNSEPVMLAVQEGEQRRMVAKTQPRSRKLIPESERQEAYRRWPNIRLFWGVTAVMSPA